MMNAITASSISLHPLHSLLPNSMPNAAAVLPLSMPNVFNSFNECLQCQLGFCNMSVLWPQQICWSYKPYVHVWVHVWVLGGAGADHDSRTCRSSRAELHHQQFIHMRSMAVPGAPTWISGCGGCARQMREALDREMMSLVAWLCTSSPRGWQVNRKLQLTVQPTGCGLVLCSLWYFADLGHALGRG